MTYRTDSGPIMPLERQCIRPGLWLIEGYAAERTSRRWDVFDPADRLLVGSLRTFADVLEWIRGEIR
jgi:hypothetical protein